MIFIGKRKIGIRHRSLCDTLPPSEENATRIDGTCINGKSSSEAGYTIKHQSNTARIERRPPQLPAGGCPSVKDLRQPKDAWATCRVRI